VVQGLRRRSDQWSRASPCGPPRLRPSAGTSRCPGGCSHRPPSGGSSAARQTCPGWLRPTHTHTSTHTHTHIDACLWLAETTLRNAALHKALRGVSLPGPACGRPPGGPQPRLHGGGSLCCGRPSGSWGPSRQLEHRGPSVRGGTGSVRTSCCVCSYVSYPAGGPPSGAPLALQTGTAAGGGASPAAASG